MRHSEALRVAHGRRGRAVGWRPLWRIFRAEALKQHRNLFGSKLVLFSLLVWPALQLATTYYTFKPFLGAPGFESRWSVAAQPGGVLLFVTTGMLGYTFFWSLVQSAWHFSFERFHGTLELLFLSPASRMGLLLANGATALVQSAWLFLTFAVGLIAIVGGLKVAHPVMYVVAFLGLLLPAVAWARSSTVSSSSRATAAFCTRSSTSRCPSSPACACPFSRCRCGDA